MPNSERFLSQEVIVPIGLLVVVGCMLVPLPPLLLDLLLCSNLLFALLLVIGALHVRDPLKIATLPSLLLIATLVRLSLNLATTRAVLGAGHAGKAVEAFGTVVIQGSMVVGFVLFLLITVIQFIVVAKGAERVAEVSARFTLDALPGKQMAIDAEIRAGLLDPEGARRKRSEVQSESRFYGALDGAMKFVKGDAIAGLVITFVNITGGLLVGLLVHNLDIEVALRRYTLLTIGDGLLSQIPSLLNSIAAGLVVTRVQIDESTSLSRDLIAQLSSFRSARIFVACAAFALGCVPGMPYYALFGVAIALSFTLLTKRSGLNDPQDEVPIRSFEPTLSPIIQIDVNRGWVAHLPKIDLIAAELEGVREYAFQRWGIVVPLPGLAANDQMTGTFRILVRGMEVYADQSEVGVGQWSDVCPQVCGCIDRHRADLLDDAATRRSLDYVERGAPDLVNGVVPGVISLTQTTALLRGFLREGVTIKHMDVILQTVAESGAKLNERALLAEVRCALASVVCLSVSPHHRQIDGITLEPLLDLVLSRAEESASLLPGDVVDAICAQVSQVVQPGLVLVTSKRARAYLRDLMGVRGGDVTVLAHEELSPRFSLVSRGMLELGDDAHRQTLLQSLM